MGGSNIDSKLQHSLELFSALINDALQGQYANLSANDRVETVIY